MPFDGTGLFSPSSPEYPAIPGTLIEAADWNAIVEDFAAGLSNCIARDGQSSMAGNLNMGGFRVTNMQGGTSAGQGLRFEQLFSVPNVLLGTLEGVTQAPGDSSTKLATTAFVIAQALGGALPGQAGNAGKVVQTDGVNASWQFALPTPQKFVGDGPYVLAGTVNSVRMIFVNGLFYDLSNFVIVGNTVSLAPGVNFTAVTVVHIFAW